MSPDALARIIGIREAMAQHDEASVLLSPGGESEKTIIWREPTTGLLVKVRVDLMRRLDAVDVYGTRLPPDVFLPLVYTVIPLPPDNVVSPSE